MQPVGPHLPQPARQARQRPQQGHVAAPASGRVAQRQPARGGSTASKPGRKPRLDRRPTAPARAAASARAHFSRCGLSPSPISTRRIMAQRPPGPGVVVAALAGWASSQARSCSRVSPTTTAGWPADDREVGHLAVDIAVGLDEHAAADAAARHHHAVRADEGVGADVRGPAHEARRVGVAPVGAPGQAQRLVAGMREQRAMRGHLHAFAEVQVARCVQQVEGADVDMVLDVQPSGDSMRVALLMRVCASQGRRPGASRTACAARPARARCAAAIHASDRPPRRHATPRRSAASCAPGQQHTGAAASRRGAQSARPAAARWPRTTSWPRPRRRPCPGAAPAAAPARR
jgi:hypothetical protein